VKGVEAKQDFTPQEEFGAGELDQNLAFIRRKTISVKADNV
jgi:hypothetical protein